MRARAKTTAKKRPGLKLVRGGTAKRAERYVWILKEPAFWVLAAVGAAALALLLYVLIFSPAPEYRIADAPIAGIDSDKFVRLLGAVSGAGIYAHNRIEVLSNGESFYEAEMAAIRGAERSVHLEAYIFRDGEVARRMLGLLTERAKAGVAVRMVLDGVGSFRTLGTYFDDLEAAGGKVAFYHPIRLNTLLRYNNRTHRELLIVDGRVGFVGGAGVADHWMLSAKDEPRWRDTMLRVEGDAVAGLQAAFVENWLETTGEILAGEADFPFPPADQALPALVVNSSPSKGASTSARVLFQTLLASARESVYIVTPYFVPDASARDELVRAQRRGVDVKILVPGSKNDIASTRRSSRRLYGELLAAGVEIYEYQPSMMHAKVMIVDGVWSVVGSTNFDNRSFGLNDEVNLAALDRNLAARLLQDFRRDLAQSEQITYEKWQRRPLWERVAEQGGWLLQRQQ